MVTVLRALLSDGDVRPDLVPQKRTPGGLHGPLRTLLGDTLAPSVVGRRRIFDANGVNRLIEADAAGQVDGARMLLAVLCIELWCQAFVDGHAPALGHL